MVIHSHIKKKVSSPAERQCLSTHLNLFMSHFIQNVLSAFGWDTAKHTYGTLVVMFHQAKLKHKYLNLIKISFDDLCERGNHSEMSNLRGCQRSLKT